MGILSQRSHVHHVHFSGQWLPSYATRLIETVEQKDKSVAIPQSLETQANIVKWLIQQGAYKIAKDFIDFIEAKTKEGKPKKGS